MNDLQQRLNAIVKAYDVRGTYPEQFDADIALLLGLAFAAFLREQDPDATTVMVGRDMRPSGPELTEAFAAGLMSQGFDVVDLGLISTDEMYFAAGSMDAPGAVFTASHNPAGYQGIKMCRRGAAPVSTPGLEFMRDYAGTVDVDDLPAAETTGTLSHHDVLAGLHGSSPQLRRCQHAETAQGRHRYGQWHGRLGRTGCIRRSAVHG